MSRKVTKPKLDAVFRKRRFVVLWPLFLPAGIVLTAALWGLLAGEGLPSLLTFAGWKKTAGFCLNMYGNALSRKFWYVWPMAVYALSMLTLALICWFRKPCFATWCGTILAGLVLCGLPGVLILTASAGGMPGDSWLIPVGDGRVTGYVPPPRPWGALIIASAPLLIPLRLAFKREKAETEPDARRNLP